MATGYSLLSQAGHQAARPPPGGFPCLFSATLCRLASASSEGRAVVSRQVDAPARAVWDVLSDGWLYASWVVGASRVRDVSPGSHIFGNQI